MNLIDFTRISMKRAVLEGQLALVAERGEYWFNVREDARAKLAIHCPIEYPVPSGLLKQWALALEAMVDTLPRLLESLSDPASAVIPSGFRADVLALNPTALQARREEVRMMLNQAKHAESERALWQDAQRQAEQAESELKQWAHAERVIRALLADAS